MSVAMAGERISGGCLCGAVRFTATASDGEMGACHCGMCRRWTGGVFLYVSVEPDSLSIEDDSQLGVYRSSPGGERCFCKACGSSVIWRKPDGSSADVSAQAIDDPARFPFAVQVWMDDKPANYDFANKTRRFPGDSGSASFGGRQGVGD
jgi:hypothetical protein